MRGEHTSPEKGNALGVGPSPRALGAQAARDLRPLGEGTIPACAGSTTIAAASSARCGDHPRVRGEHYAGITIDPGVRGPSPRARGALEIYKP